MKTNSLDRSLILAAALAAAVCAASSVQATVITWTGLGADNSWTTPDNWTDGSSPVAPVSGDSLVFAGSTRLTTNTNGIPGSPTFTGITFAASAGAFSLGGAAVGIKLNGDVVNNSSSAQRLYLQTTLVGATLIGNTAGGSVALDYLLTLNGGSALDLNGNNVHVTAIANGTAGTKTITSATPAKLSFSGASGSYTFSGDISGAISTVFNNHGFAAAQIFDDALTYTGTTTCDAPIGTTVSLYATSTGAGGRLLNTGAISVKNGGGIWFDYSVVTAANAPGILNRIPEAVSFKLSNGGSLVVKGSNSGGAGITQTFTPDNVPTIDGYGLLGVVSYGNLRPTTIALPSLDRNGRSIGLLRGSNLGGTDTGVAQTAITVPTADAPALVGEGTGTGYQVQIVPWLIGDTTWDFGGVGRNLTTTYDAGGGRTGFRTLADTEFVRTALADATDDDNVKLDLGTGLAGNVGKTVGSLIIRYTGTENHTYSFAGTDTLTLKTGVLAISGNTSILNGYPSRLTSVTLDGFDALDFGDSEGIIFASLRGYRSTGVQQTYNWGLVTVNVPIQGNNGLTKAGLSELIINAQATYTGRTTVSGGKLTVNDTDYLPTGTTVDLNTDSLLAIASGETQTVAGLEGTGTATGTVIVAAGGHVAPGHSVGTLTAGALTLSAGSVLDFDLAGPGTNDLLVTTGLLTLGSGLTLSLTDAGGLTGGTYTLIDYATLSGSVGNIGTINGPGGFRYALTNTGSVIQLVVTATPRGTLVTLK